ncbi:MAG: riboflavin synthase [Candidatus Levybacteria bacterium]|nr:riboflavin synthase [Candidatus Levybacteria bacterium]
MFTGIITHLGICKDKSDSGILISAPKSFANVLKKGSSVAVNGICLTITSKSDSSFRVDIMPETWKKTAMSKLSPHDVVNLELPMAANGRFEGHIAQGHVDGVAKIVKIEKKKNSWVFKFKTHKKLTSFMIEKGSVAVNGISLTIISVTKTTFTVGIIPYTFTNTMLYNAKINDLVNIETDMLGKYLLKFLKQAKKTI